MGVINLEYFQNGDTSSYTLGVDTKSLISNETSSFWDIYCFIQNLP